MVHDNVKYFQNVNYKKNKEKKKKKRNRNNSMLLRNII